MASFSSSNGRPAFLPKDNAWLFLTIKAALFTCLADVSFAAIQTNPLCRPHQAIGCWILLIIPLALILLIIPLANKAWLIINAQGLPSFNMHGRASSNQDHSLMLLL